MELEFVELEFARMPPSGIGFCADAALRISNLRGCGVSADFSQELSIELSQGFFKELSTELFRSFSKGLLHKLSEEFSEGLSKGPS